MASARLLLILLAISFSSPKGIFGQSCFEETNIDLMVEDESSRPIKTMRGVRSISQNDYTTITPNNRSFCPETPENRPPNRVNTTIQVSALREVMKNVTLTGGYDLDAYVVNNGNEHGIISSLSDQKIAYISGYTGTSGLIIVTKDRAALWTDGRYFLQAEKQLDCDWILMKSGQPGYPSQTQWLNAILRTGANIGADPKTLSSSIWLSLSNGLASNNITVREVPQDLIDSIWTTGRPDKVNNPLMIHTLDFAGRTRQDKLAEVRTKITKRKQDSVLMVTDLAETAWLFNLRGQDSPTSPLFNSYVIIWQDEVTLFLKNLTKLLTSEIREHLNTNANGTCQGKNATCIQVEEYDMVYERLREVAGNAQVSGIWLSTSSSSYAIYSAAGAKLDAGQSPIQLMKSIKNPTERRRYYECQVRDSAAVVEFAAFLEEEVSSGRTWTEMAAADKLSQIRREYLYNKGDSFPAISAVGPNAAVIHYRATNETDTVIVKDKVYLLDSGGQYLDGTTDVTRTFLFGNAEELIKEAYTRVLLAVIELATTVWPIGTYGRDIDGRARTPLWQNGWDYNHGTGHGIGYYLNVHEGPGRINIGYSPDQAPLYEGMFFSDEPGFYENGKFGIRLETIVGVEKMNTTYRFGDKDYLGFKPATLVPFESNLIKYEMLNSQQRKWLNDYNDRCVKEVGKYLQEQNKPKAVAWIEARTAHIPDIPYWEDPTISSGNSPYAVPVITSIFMSILSFILVNLL